MDSHSSNHSAERFVLSPESSSKLLNLCGPLNSHLHELERHFDVQIANRGYQFIIKGENGSFAANCLKKLYDHAEKTLTLEDIHAALQESTLREMNEQRDQSVSEMTSYIHDKEEPEVIIRTPNRVIKARGTNQRNYVRNIERFDLCFAVGPAGTGKTYLAVAKAIELLERDVVEKLILVRPAVEAGEQLGFLPGDLIQKIDPYLRPMYDALFEMLTAQKFERLMEQGVIEIAPLAYMRGRTLNNAFIILDEAQNTTKEQLKMFLTRIGTGSKATVTGDLTQADLPHRAVSGLEHALKVLKGLRKVSVNHLDIDDVIRHPLLRDIIQAYESDEAKTLNSKLKGQ